MQDGDFIQHPRLGFGRIEGELDHNHCWFRYLIQNDRYTDVDWVNLRGCRRVVATTEQLASWVEARMRGDYPGPPSNENIWELLL